MSEAAHIIDLLESVRLKLEERFLRAGTTMASALEGIEALIAALDKLNSALEGETSARAMDALQGAADDLLGLPEIQAERRLAFETLVLSSTQLGSNIETMHTLLRYLRTFALNLKITAAAAPEFVGFAQEVMDRIAMGADKLASFGAKLAELDDQLRCALGFAHALDADCDHLVPAVARDLRTSAEAIQGRDHEISVTAVRVAELVRRIQAKVGSALIAMQIGDNTRQRIEHVQAGLERLARDFPAEGPGEAARHDAANAVRRVLLKQLADLTEAFTAEARVVSDNLLGLSGDASEVLRLKTLIGEGQTGGFLRDLEAKVGQAQRVVDKVRSVNVQAGEAGRAAVGAVEALLANVDAIQSVKTDIRYMAINTSLRCSRMGEAGRPVNVIGLELRASADKLGEAADRTMNDLDGLTGGAHRFVDHETGADLGGELDQALQSIRAAGDGAEADLDIIARRSADVAQAMEQLSADAYFHKGLAVALDEAHAALDAITDPRPGPADGVNPALQATLNEIFKLYTMERERKVHRMAAPSGLGQPVSTPANTGFDEEEDDTRLASASF